MASFFGEKGKKTACYTWKAYREVTPAFCALAAKPSPRPVQEWLGPLERFVIVLYNHSSSQTSVCKLTRKQLFTQKGRTIENLLPTQVALVHRIKRAFFQAAIKVPELSSPNEWGGKS